MPDPSRVVLLGGRVLDPASGRDETLNVVIEDGRIAALTGAPCDPVAGENRVDLGGCLVTPGLIDHHCHLYPLAERIGLPGDAVLLSSGVTSAVDAGSSGARNYPWHLSLGENSFLTYRAYVNVSSLGLTAEDPDPAHYDLGLLRELFAEHGDRLLGLKLRSGREQVGALGLAPLRATLEIAEKLGVSVMVHPTDPPGELEDLLDLLRPGDVCTHMYMNRGSALVTPEGRVKDAAWRARERGVLFEAADARTHFGFSVALPAIRQGFLPDFIATDGTRLSMLRRPTTFSLAMQLARYEALGIPFMEVLRRCTATPARHMGLTEGEGTLRVGGTADIAVFRRHEGKVLFADRPDLDPVQETLTGGAVYEPVLTVKRGMVVYRNLLI